MQNLKRRWNNFSSASRLLVIIAGFSILALVSLVLFLTQNQPVTDKPAEESNTSNPASPSPPPTISNFNYAAEPDASPSPVPKNEAARLLTLANRYLADGEAVDAAAQYRLILTSYPKSPEVAEAAFGLAQSSVARERWQEANELFKKFLVDYPKDNHRRLALYGLADVQKALGNWNEAIDYYQQYLQDKDGKLLEGYALFDIAEALNNTTKKEQAIEYYKKAGLSTNGSNQLRVIALERVGDYYAAANNAGAALEWYNRILEIAKMPEYRAGIMLKMAKVYNANKQTNQANTLYNVIADQYLETTAGLSAVRALITANPTVTSDFHKGYEAYRSSNWSEAISAFSKMLGRADDKVGPTETPALPANLAKAEQEKLARVWYWLGRSYEQKGDPTRAANEYRELQIRLPQTDMAQEALWRVAVILRNAGQNDAAMAQYKYIYTTYPAGRYAEQAIYNQADIVLTRNGPEAALPLINAFATNEKYLASELKNELLYDLYRAFEAKGNKEAARTALQKAATSTSADYYAIRATDILAGLNPLNLPRSNPISHPAVYDPVRFMADAEKDRKAMESWLLTWANTTPVQGTPIQAQGQPQVTLSTKVQGSATTNTNNAANAIEIARQNLRNDAGLKRLAELQRLSRRAQVEREAKEGLERYQGKPIELYLLALNLNEQSQYYNSIIAAQDLLALYRDKKVGAGLRATPMLLQKLIYPLDYQNLVLEQTRKNEVDPLLFLALIKQESAFKSDAVSSVGARGLTQVMPETGRAIATNLDKPGYNADNLFQPALAIEFGAFYLARRLQDFGGNPYAALGAYNAGAGNVYRWVEESPPERGFDNFVENIDFRETRGYIKIIYTSYAMYRQIYSAPNP